MKNLVKNLSIGAILCAAAGAHAQSAVTVDTSTYSDGSTYMSWSPTAHTTSAYPGDGGSSSGGWSIAALPAVISGNTVTLSPNVNVYAAGNGYWTNPDGTGANNMDGAIYTQTTGVYMGTSLTFTFNVLANTLAAGYTADAFIKDFGPGFSYYNGEQTVNLTPGVDSVTFNTGNASGEVVQYGFELIGPDANPSTAAGLGSVEVAATPEPTTVSLVGLGLLAALGGRRLRKS